MSIKVYGFWRSIASFRIRVALKLKALPFEEISIDILQGEQFKPGYDAVNPEHVVPTFIHDGHSLYQSLAIMEYLDDIKPSPRLLPDDIKERAYARSLALMTIADAHPLTVPRVRKHLAQDLWRRRPRDRGSGVRIGPPRGLRPMSGFWRAARQRLLRSATTSALPISASRARWSARNISRSGSMRIRWSRSLSDRCFALPEFASSHPFEQPDYKASGAKH